MTTRRDFIATGTGAAALAALGTQASANAPKTAKKPDAFIFDQAAYTKIVSAPATHKLGFGAKEPDDGSITWVIKEVIRVWDEELHVLPNQVHPVAIFYHLGALLALNDDLWNQLYTNRAKFPHLQTILNASKPNAGNPYGVALEALAAKGASFLVCNNALTGLAGSIALALNLDATATVLRVRTSLIPGSLAVPAGVWAIGAIQEAGFTYQQVS